MFKPKHTLENVAERLAEGLRDGSIVLRSIEEETARQQALQNYGVPSYETQSKPLYRTDMLTREEAMKARGLPLDNKDSN